MRDALKNYLTLASGLTEVGRQRALAASKALVAQGEATAEQVSGLADDLIQTSKNNRELISALVRSEVEKALNVVGLATADSVEKLTKRLQSLESALRDASSQDDAPAGSAPAAGDAGATPDGAAAKTAAKKVAQRVAKQPAATEPAQKPAAKAGGKPDTKGAGQPAAKAAKQPSKQQPAKQPAKPAAKAPAKTPTAKKKAGS